MKMGVKWIENQGKLIQNASKLCQMAICADFVEKLYQR